MYVYVYKDVEYKSWNDVRSLPEFKNVCFAREGNLAAADLAALGIVRKLNPLYEPRELTDEEKVFARQAEVRDVRNRYLREYVDPKQLCLVWGDLSEQNKQCAREYRRYLLDYTESPGWWEEEPKSYAEWLGDVYGV